MINVHKVLKTGTSLAICLGLLAGCANFNNSKKGAVIGGAAGAVIGGIIGNKKDKTSRGVLIGTAVGGTAGAIIGRQMDKQAEELEKDLDGVEIDRVGEGIHLTFDSAILFEVDEAQLSPTSKANLDKLATSLEEYPQTDLVIAGHTDSSGSEEYNEDLSKRRAQAAERYLIRQNVSPGRIVSVGYGETDPVATNETVDGRMKNRRVEIAIYASEEYRDSLENSN